MLRTRMETNGRVAIAESPGDGLLTSSSALICFDMTRLS